MKMKMTISNRIIDTLFSMQLESVSIIKLLKFFMSIQLVWD